MRWRIDASGRRPYAAFMFSRTWATLVVAGIALVTAGRETLNFYTSSAQLVQSISAAHGGSGCRARARTSAPSRNGRFTITAMP